ncbi:MAG: Mut7-C RNAse domain-containing protein [Planctomycetota bacterium]
MSRILFVTDANAEPISFLCDAMLGGLARWLRAAGYDAQFIYGIEDPELIERAVNTGGMILSSDGPLFERNVIKSGEIRALYIPQQLSKLDQLQFVMHRLRLELRDPRCMACGGHLREVPKHKVIGEAPPLAYRNCERFWRCERCGKLLWGGTHWQKITRRLEQITRSR